jgi:hypothetical protein
MPTFLCVHCRLQRWARLARNYGRIGGPGRDNLMEQEAVVQLLKRNGITTVRVCTAPRC